MGAGLLAYKLSKKADRNKLLAIAAHEVCHMRHSTHDECYARALTELFGRVMSRAKEIGVAGKTENVDSVLQTADGCP
jgi:hypothetical protein